MDVAQDVIVREDDCGTDASVEVTEIREGQEVIEKFEKGSSGAMRARMLSIRKPKCWLVAYNEMIDGQARPFKRAGITSVKIRSVLTCKTRYGVCSKCYGKNLATGRPVEIGEAVALSPPNPSASRGHS